jgi:DNA-binding transcriptional MerR regulator
MFVFLSDDQDTKTGQDMTTTKSLMAATGSARHAAATSPAPGSQGAGQAALYSVSQLARQLGVTARTIRFYEDKGLITPQRAGTTRVYTHRDRARLMLILRGKRLGFSLREVKEFLDLYDIDPTQHVQLRQLMIGVRKRVTKLQEQRTALEQSLQELLDIEQQVEAALKARSL